MYTNVHTPTHTHTATQMHTHTHAHTHTLKYILVNIYSDPRFSQTINFNGKVRHKNSGIKSNYYLITTIITLKPEVKDRLKLWERYESPYSPSNGQKSTTNFPLQGCPWH